ncbi:unnamed protein product [Ectocarpus fasciculatus]
MPVRPRTDPSPERTQSQGISFLKSDAFPGLRQNNVLAGLQAENPSSPQDGGASLAVDAFLIKNRVPDSEYDPQNAGDTTTDGGARDRHPHGVFHAHAHDMAYLEQWIGEMLMLDIRRDVGGGEAVGPEGGQPKVSHPQGKDPESKRESLTHLYNEKALRYGIVFDELIRQVAVHSMALATLVGKAFTGHHALLTRLIKVHDAREGQLQKLQAQLAGLTGESNRKMNEEDALIEEQAFMENLTKAELRESRALCSSLRVKLKYYGDEVARLRQGMNSQIVLDKIDDDEQGPRNAKVHNSLTEDGVSMPILPAGKKAIAASKSPARKAKIERPSLAVDDVVTILELSTEKMNMHARHETELNKMLSQISTESSKQTSDVNALAKLIDGVHFMNFLKGINKEGRKAMRRTKETQTRPMRDKKSDSRPGTGTGGKKRPPKKTKGSKTEILPLDLRNSIGMASAPKKIPTLGYMLRTVLDMMLVWSRSLDTAESLCKKPGGMTEIAIKHFQLLHGMENTTNLMLAQFAAGLVHFADYKRCKVLGDLLGVDDPTTGPPFDHRSALFLYRFLAELRTVGVFNEDILRERIIKINLNKTAAARAARTVLGPTLPQGSPPMTVLIPCLQDANNLNSKRARPGERGKRGNTMPPGEVPLAKQTVEFDELLPQAMLAWRGVWKHRVSHINLAFDRYSSTFQARAICCKVTEEMRFGADDAPKARDAVIVQLSKSLVEGRQRRKLYDTARQAEGATQHSTGEPGMMMRLAEGMSKAQEDRLDIQAYSTASPQAAMSWVVETTGEATCMKDYISMNAPVVELLSEEDLTLALNYLNPTLSNVDIRTMYKKGRKIQWDNTHTLFRGLWAQEETDVGKKYWVHMIHDLTQWAVPFNMNDFKREEIDREAFVELCLSSKVLDSSPLAPHFLAQPQALWDGWDNLVAALGRKEMRNGTLQDSKRPAAKHEP